jgi:hypothetical protein
MLLLFLFPISPAVSLLSGYLSDIRVYEYKVCFC